MRRSALQSTRSSNVLKYLYIHSEVAYKIALNTILTEAQLNQHYESVKALV